MFYNRQGLSQGRIRKEVEYDIQNYPFYSEITDEAYTLQGRWWIDRAGEDHRFDIKSFKGKVSREKMIRLWMELPTIRERFDPPEYSTLPPYTFRLKRSDFAKFVEIINS